MSYNIPLDSSGDVSFDGTISASHFVGDGSQLTGLPGGISSNPFDQDLNTTDSPTFATLTATEVVSDEITSTSRTNNFDLNGSNSYFFGSTAKYFQNAVAFRPATADENIDLGIDIRRWNGVYAVDGDFSGEVTTANVLPISDASGLLGSASSRFNTLNTYNASLKGTLTQETGSIFKMYSVGDSSAADTSYLQFNPVAGDFYLGTKKTGTETAGDLFLQHDSGTKASINSTGLRLHNLPSSDPSIAGQLWNDGGTLKVSTGPVSTTATLNVTVNADDGYVTKSSVFNPNNPGTYDALATTSGSSMFMGGFYNDDENEYNFYASFFRFRGLNVAQGTTITAASLKFTKSAGTGSTSQDLTLAGLDSTTGIGTTGIGGAAIAHTNHTTATVAFPNLMGSSNDEKTSPDIKTIVQEIVDRGDWSSGDSITIVCYANSVPSDTTARIQARSKEFSSGSAVAELSITYTS